MADNRTPFVVKKRPPTYNPEVVRQNAKDKMILDWAESLPEQDLEVLTKCAAELITGIKSKRPTTFMSIKTAMIILVTMALQENIKYGAEETK